MSLFISTFLQISPVFLVVMLGYCLKALRVLDEEAIRSLSRFVYYVAIAPLMFQSIASTDFNVAFDAKVVLSGMFVLVLFSAAVYLLASLWLPAAQRGVVTQGASRSNLVFVGFAVFVDLYGRDVIPKTAVFVAFQALVVNVLAVVFLLLPYHSLSRSANWLRLVRETALNPVIIGSAAGMVCSGFSLKVPFPCARTLDWIGQTALPLAMLTVGASLGGSKIGNKAALVSLTCLLKLALLPAATLLVMRALGVRGQPLSMAVILFASPTAVISYILTRELGGDEELASAVVMVTTVISPLSMTLWVVLLRHSPWLS
jgi:predicted permease